MIDADLELPSEEPEEEWATTSDDVDWALLIEELRDEYDDRMQSIDL